METIHNMNFQNNDIVLPDSTDLDWAQIIYSINSKRLIFINNCKTWLNFHTENGYQYIDYTPEELCQRFLKLVLPNIFEYELAENELHLLNLLDLHPSFVRTDSGFYTVEQTENFITFPSNEAAIESVMKQKYSFKQINFVGDNVESNHQIIINSTRGQNYINRNLNFSAENGALLSVILCSDEDLPNYELLNMEEMLKRLKAAKSRFENNGEELNNINTPINVLLKKLVTLNKLKQVVTKLVDKNFRRRNKI